MEREKRKRKEERKKEREKNTDEHTCWNLILGDTLILNNKASGKNKAKTG